MWRTLPLLCLLGVVILLSRDAPPLSGGPPPRPEERFPATAEKAVPPAPPVPSSPARRGPDLAGEVVDGEGCLVPGAAVLVTDPGGEVLTRVECGPEGLFALRLDAAPPLVVRAGVEGAPVTVLRLPRLDLELPLPAPAANEDELIVRPAGGGFPAGGSAEILILDATGRIALRVRRGFPQSPWTVGPLPHGLLDVVVRGGGLAGRTTAFPFGPCRREAVVEMAAAGGLRAALSRRARAILLRPEPPPARPSRALREEDGLAARVRGTIARIEFAEEVRWTGLPAGAYRLRLLGPGVETLELPVEVTPGETRDLGRIDLAPAGASLSVDLDEGGPRRHGYEVALHSPAGLCLRRLAEPGGTEPVRFEGLSSGEWYLRAGRRMDDPGHTQAVGWHRRVDLAPGEARTVREDCTWRFD